jgi:hypothetical protein
MVCGGEWNVPGYQKQPGTTLHKIIRRLGLKPTKDCACIAMIAKMNGWGVDGCRQNRGEIILHLQQAYEEMTWGEWLEAIGLAAKTGFILRIKPWGKFNSLLDEAIRLTIESEAASTSRTR